MTVCNKTREAFAYDEPWGAPPNRRAAQGPIVCIWSHLSKRQSYAPLRFCYEPPPLMLRRTPTPWSLVEQRALNRRSRIVINDKWPTVGFVVSAQRFCTRVFNVRMRNFTVFLLSMSFSWHMRTWCAIYRILLSASGEQTRMRLCYAVKTHFCSWLSNKHIYLRKPLSIQIHIM